MDLFILEYLLFTIFGQTKTYIYIYIYLFLFSLSQLSDVVHISFLLSPISL